MNEVTLPLRELVAIYSALVTTFIALISLIGVYWKLRLSINDLKSQMDSLNKEKLDKKDFAVYQSETQKEIGDGMKEIIEVFHGMDKKQAIMESTLQHLVEK